MIRAFACRWQRGLIDDRANGSRGRPCWGAVGGEGRDTAVNGFVCEGGGGGGGMTNESSVGEREESLAAGHCLCDNSRYHMGVNWESKDKATILMRGETFFSGEVKEEKWSNQRMTPAEERQGVK